MNLDKANREIHKTFDDCCLRDWDGEDAEPITLETVESCKEFFKSFPEEITLFDYIVPEPNGRIGFEWYSASCELNIVISVSTTRYLYCVLYDGVVILSGESNNLGPLHSSLDAFLKIYTKLPRNEKFTKN